MRVIGGANVIVHGGASGGRVYVECASLVPNVVEVHGAEIYAETREAGGVGHCGVQLSSGKEHDTANVGDYADLRIGSEWSLRARLLAGIGLDVLRGVLAAGAVPLVVIGETGAEYQTSRCG
jgi:hypothetical protein